MADDILLIDTQDRVRTLTLNRPQSRNALSAELRRRFFGALRDAEAGDDVDVVIVTGTDPGVLRGPGPQGAGRFVAAAGYLAAVAADDQARDRRHQRRGRDGRARARAVLRHPDRLRAGPLRRHPRPGGAASHLGAVGAACRRRPASA